mgnify:CR=1 FL=1
MNDIKLQESHPLDKHLRPIKVDDEVSALEISTDAYGEPYAYWTEGNNLRRTNFAGYVANKFRKKIANKLAPAIGKDVANMIRKKLKTNNNNVIKAY